MQIEIYNMTVLNDKLNISLEAVCDSFSSLLWDIEYYKLLQGPEISRFSRQAELLGVMTIRIILDSSNP